MYQLFPGTKIEVGNTLVNLQDSAKEVLNNIFSAGGLVLSQVTNLTGLEYYIIQNWIKRGFLQPPDKKMYSKRQFCRIVIINMLKDTMQIDRIVQLLSYINGVLSDESDDLIDDAELYNYYVNIAFSDDGHKEADKIVDDVIKSYIEPIPGAKRRLHKVLLAMYYAGLANRYRNKCEQILFELS